MLPKARGMPSPVTAVWSSLDKVARAPACLLLLALVKRQRLEQWRETCLCGKELFSCVHSSAGCISGLQEEIVQSSSTVALDPRSRGRACKRNWLPAMLYSLCASLISTFFDIEDRKIVINLLLKYQQQNYFLFLWTQSFMFAVHFPSPQTLQGMSSCSVSG